MSDRLSPDGRLLNPNILRRQDNRAASGGKAERQGVPISQRVVVSKERPKDQNVTLVKDTTYMLGREDPKSQLESLGKGYDTIDIVLERGLKNGEGHTLSRRQMSIAFAEEIEGRKTTEFLYVHNKASSGDILIFNRGYEQRDIPNSDGLRRLAKTSRHFNLGEEDDGGITTIENMSNTVLLVPLTSEKVLCVEVMGIGSEMTLDAWEIDRALYDNLRERALAREKAAEVPQKQAVRAYLEEPGDKPQIKLEPGKKYKVGRKTGDGSNQKAAEDAGFGFIEITGDHGQQSLSRDQLEIEVVGDPESPELRVKNTGRDHVTIYNEQGKVQDKLFGRIQQSKRAKRRTTIPVNAGLRLDCGLNSQFNLSLEPKVLSDGTVGLYVSEHP